MHVPAGLWNGSGLQVMVCDSGVGDNMAGAGTAPAAEQSPPPPTSTPVLLQRLQAYSHLIYLLH